MKNLFNISGALALLFLTFLFFITGCSISDEIKTQDILGPELNDTTLTTNPALLTGKWQWQWSTIFFTSEGPPSRVYAEDAEYRERLVFAGDSVFIYRSDEPVKSYTFITEKSHLQFGGQSPVFGVNREKLVLSTAHVDGPEKVYYRIEE